MSITNNDHINYKQDIQKLTNNGVDDDMNENPQNMRDNTITVKNNKNNQHIQQDQSSSFLGKQSQVSKYQQNHIVEQRNQVLSLYLILAVIVIVILAAIGINLKFKLSALTSKMDQYYFMDDPSNIQEDMQNNQLLFTHALMIDSDINKQLEDILKGSFYDVHYFLKDSYNCPHQNPLIVHNASLKEFAAPRTLLNITKTDKQLQQIIQNMKHNQYRPKQFPNVKLLKRIKPESIDLAYFFYALVKNPNKTDYIQAQFYRYDKLYNISKYSQQLPLCVSLIGKNNAKNIEILYNSILRQNYTNYKIIHVDDNSDDDTQQKILKMIKENKILQERLTLISQQRRRNQLYNRDLSIRSYCNYDDIVLDMDADDFIIGNQVFQLINSIYQAGHIYKQKHQQIWSLYFSHIVLNSYCNCILPNIDGQIPESDFTQHTYRSTGKWRTTQLRTFKKKIYLKIDTKDFIDKESPNQEFYIESSDAFINSAILQLSGPRHLKTLDQFLYFYVISKQRVLQRGASIDFFYSVYMAQSITPYENLQDLDDAPRRVRNFKLSYKNYMHKKIKTWEVRQTRTYFKELLINALKKFNKENKDKI